MVHLTQRFGVLFPYTLIIMKSNQSSKLIHKLFGVLIIPITLLSLLSAVPLGVSAAAAGFMDGFVYADMNTTVNRAPSVEFFNDAVYIAYVNDSNVIVTRKCTLNGTQMPTCYAWQNSDGQTPNNLDMAVFNGRLYQTVRGTDSRIYNRSMGSNEVWTGWKSNNDGFTPSTPSMAAFKGKLYQSVRGTDNRIYVQSSSDGTSWSGWRSNDDGRTLSPIGMGGTSNQLCQSVIGTDGGSRMYSRCSSDGNTWGGWRGEDGASSRPVAVLNVKEDTAEYIMQFCTGTDNNVYYKAMNYYGWSGYAQDNFTNDGVSAAARTDSNQITTAIAVAYRGSNNKIYLEVNYLN
ncbi:MAG: hypothetical protein OHK0017_00600 [Patescibacteria group bacterium]